MNEIEYLMIEGACIGALWIIVIGWVLIETYGIRDSKRSTLSEPN